MRLTIFGTGYVGLVSGACLADVGHDVLCVDIDAAKIARLNQGEIPIHEPGLGDLVALGMANGTLRFTTDIAEAVRHADVQVIAVGTPPDESGAADLQYVLAVARSIAAHMDEPKVVVVKSTVPVGTCDRVRQALTTELAALGRPLSFDVVSNPEFLKEGAAVNDFLKPDRIVVGADSPHARAVLGEIYEPFNRSHDRTLYMDVRSSELTKYAANAMLATKISFINEIANLAELLGADIEQVRLGIGADPRIGYQFIYPGLGYGGSCFPKDVQALARTADEIGYDAQLLKAVEAVNNRQKQTLFHKIAAHFGGADKLSGKRIALWGLAFKPNTDDMRAAPASALMESLWAAGATISAYDPVAMDEARRLHGERDDLVLMPDKYSALDQCDALAICTEWSQFRAPDFDEIALRLKQRLVFDGRNIYAPERLRADGWTYYSVGRGTIRQGPEPASSVL